MKSSLDLLLVDASPSARYALRLLLQRHGMQVRSVESAERALALIGNSAPDAVVTASVLPGMNGLELLELLKADRTTAQIPLVICCPDGSWPFAQTALQRGALAVLPRDRLKHDTPGVLAQIEAALAATPAPEPEPEPEPTQKPEPKPAPSSETAAPAHRFIALARIWKWWRRRLHSRMLDVVFVGVGVMLLEGFGTVPDLNQAMGRVAALDADCGVYYHYAARYNERLGSPSDIDND